jgi:3-methyladenine DNA glycosylase AlkC
MSANHMEQMAIDMGALLVNAFPGLAKEADRLREGGLVTKMRTGGVLLFEAFGEDAWDVSLDHESDSIRGWGAMAIGACPSLSLATRLSLIKPFADDPHFAVREWAWLAVRPRVIAEPRNALGLLQPWTSRSSSRLRRFASEATRPRGVWSAHIPLLKEQPQLAAPLLEALRIDSSAYVQNSVGNWLNDASKSTPTWVRATCEAWLAESPESSTQRICTRALRTLNRSARATSQRAD